MINSITCPVCENLCSSQAVSCPKCGHPFVQETARKTTPQKTNNFSCPKCGSDQTSTLKMVYSQGTSSGNLSAGTFSLGGDVALTSGKVKSQSVLARQVAPPRKPVMDLPKLLFILAIVLIIGVFLSMFSAFFLLLTFIALVGVGYYYYLSVQNQIPEYEEEINEWKKGRICLRCGNKWQEAEDRNSSQSLFGNLN